KTSVQYCGALPLVSAFLVRKCEKFLALHTRCFVVSAKNKGPKCDSHRTHQAGCFPALARFLERLFSIHKGSFGIAKCPQNVRPDRHRTARRPRTVLGRIIESYSPIEVCPTLHCLSRIEECGAHHAMADHERDDRSLFLCKRQAVSSKIAGHVAIEC